MVQRIFRSDRHGALFPGGFSRRHRRQWSNHHFDGFARRGRDVVPWTDFHGHEAAFSHNSRNRWRPPFWEDQLFGPDKNILPRFRIGEAHFEGSNPCARCPVPPRNPHTGAEFTGFQKRFTEQRRATLPSWSPLERFDHFYRMSTNTRVTSAESGKLLRVNDPLVLL